MEYLINESTKLTTEDYILELMRLKQHVVKLQEDKEQLRDELQNTQQQLSKTVEKLSEALALIDWYEEQHRLNLHRRFGSSSERTCPEQLSLFNEV